MQFVGQVFIYQFSWGYRKSYGIFRNFRIVSSCAQFCYSSAYVVRESVCKSTTSLFPYTVYFGTYYFSIHLPLSLTEQLSTTMLKENIYVILVTQMINSFQVKYQSMLMQMTLRSYVRQLSKLDKTKTTLTSEISLKFCRVIARCKEYLSENFRIAKLWIQYIDFIYIVIFQ